VHPHNHLQGDIVTNVDMTASPRSEFGKGAARRVRRAGQIPAVLYGTDTKLIHLTLPAHELGLALRKPRVVLNIAFDGQTYLTKPRDIQRDPVRLDLEHIDLIVISKKEAALRSDYADAVAQVLAAAEEAGLDAAMVMQSFEESVANGELPLDAVGHAVEDARAKALEQASAAAATGAAEDAAASAAAAETAAPADAEPASE
jgi:large subunit ribosomal protein L25